MTLRKQLTVIAQRVFVFLLHPEIKESLLFFFLTILSAAWTRWLSANVGDFSPLWPPAGLMLAAVMLKPKLIPAVALGLFVWAFAIEGLSTTRSMLSLLTFVGAITYGLILRARHIPCLSNFSTVKDLLSHVRGIVLFAALPSAMIGSLLHANQLSEGSFLDLFAVYFIAETAGVALFAPTLSAMLSGQLSRLAFQDSQARNNILLAVCIAAMPAAAHLLGQPVYAQGLYMLIFPLICWIAVQNKNSILQVVMLIITVIHMTFESKGVGSLGQTASIFGLIERVIWLLAAFLMGNTLLAYSSERQFAFDELKRKAIQDENTQWFNQHGLEQFIDQHKTQSFNILITQVCRRDMLVSSFSFIEHRALERALTANLAHLHDWSFKARISDLTYCFLTPSDTAIPLDEETFQTRRLEGMDITIRLAWCCIPLNTTDPSASLQESYTGLQTALAKPINRVIRRAHPHESLSLSQSHFMHFQKVVAALEAGHLRLWGQPIQPVGDTRPSIELLARIQSPNGDIINPGVFLNILNVFDELELLDRAVLSAAVVKNGPLQHLAKTFGRININLSGSTICDVTFVDWLEHIWPAALPRENVCLEITESELIRNLDIAQETCKRLRQSGFQLAIDDFGSGLASFEYLEHFPADLIKIDGMFIKDITDNTTHQEMTASTITVTKTLGAQTCAEFVSDQASVELLAKMGIDYLQGFYLAKPEPVENFYSGYEIVSTTKPKAG